MTDLRQPEMCRIKHISNKRQSSARLIPYENRSQIATGRGSLPPPQWCLFLFAKVTTYRGLAVAMETPVMPPSGGVVEIAKSDQIPDRTLFYSLRPKGLNTAFVEGLTGYLRRLAVAHRVTVADLVCHEHFDSLFVNPADRRNRRRLFLASGYLLDGSGPNTDKWIEAVEIATGQTDLRSLTLSPFAGVSSFSWLRRKRAWCPRCLFLQAETDPDDIYEPLLWSVRLVSVCPKDISPLVQECPKCGKSTRPFDGLAAPGYCGNCGSPLWMA